MIKADIKNTVIDLRKIAGSLSSTQLLRRVAAEVANVARNEAYSRPGRSFWRNMGNSVSHAPKGRGYIVGATHEAAAQKQFGGVIEAPGKGPGAVKAKALTIPLGLAKENRWDADDAAMRFDLFLAKTKSGKRLLFGKPRNTKGEAQPLFLLRKRVSQRAEPWFPAGDALNKAIATGIDDYKRALGGASV